MGDEEGELEAETVADFSVGSPSTSSSLSAGEFLVELAGCLPFDLALAFNSSTDSFGDEVAVGGLGVCALIGEAREASGAGVEDVDGGFAKPFVGGNGDKLPAPNELNEGCGIVG